MHLLHSIQSFRYQTISVIKKPNDGSSLPRNLIYCLPYLALTSLCD